MSEPLNNLRAAYHVLEGRVNRALRTQVGDVPHLEEQRVQALQLLHAAEQVRRSSLSSSCNTCLTHCPASSIIPGSGICHSPGKHRRDDQVLG